MQGDEPSVQEEEKEESVQAPEKEDDEEEEEDLGALYNYVCHTLRSTTVESQLAIRGKFASRRNYFVSQNAHAVPAEWRSSHNVFEFMTAYEKVRGLQ